ncbi:MAG TPA: hypothetical protein VKI41_08120, partial [Vicinamibacteria bacterium]|nr:hypothetical protein [Vicinamibacteria bacterium]
MRTTLLLRVASVTSLLFAAGHTVGGTQEWSPMGETDVLQAMRTHRFDVMGLSRTYLDFYRGFGYTLTVTLLLQAVLLWQLASLARTEPRRVSPMIASFVLASLASTVIAWAIILPVPAVFSTFLT